MNRFLASFVAGLSVALPVGASLAQVAGQLGVVAPVEAHAYGKYYWKVWDPMTLDRTQVAVQAQNVNQLQVALKDAGVDVQAATAFTVDGWWLVTVPANTTPEQLVATLAAQPTIDFATPVFESIPLGPDHKTFPIFPTQDVMVGFAAGMPAAQRDGAFVAASVFDDTKAVLRDRDWGGMDGVDRATAASKNGFEVLAQANTLAQRADVLFAEPDMMITGMEGLIPNDTFFGDLWGVHNTGQSGGVADMDLNGPEAWDITTGSASVVVVVMDIGVQLNHPDLNIAAVNGDFTGGGTGGNPGNSCDNHGTACAGCISGIINNSLGVAGIAPTCKVASARIGISTVPCNGTWSGPISNSVNALTWAQTNGYRVTSNSNAYGSTSATLDTTYTNTHNTGNIIHFAANGNSGAGSIAYPASSPSVNACAAIDRTGVKASFSQFGTGTKFAAPGVDIDSTDRTGTDGYTSTDYNVVDGTSFATPYTAGVAALVFSRNPALTAAQVETIMYNHCKDRGAAGYDTTYGYGIPNAQTSVLAALSGPVNDICANATTVVSGGVYSGTLTNATFLAADGGSNCGNPTNGPDVWYTFTAPAAGSVRVTTCGTNDTGGIDAGIDTVVSLHDGCGGAILGCNDDWTSATTTGCTGADAGTLLRDSAVATPVLAGQIVKIRVQRYGGAAAGGFTLNVFFTPGNDTCAAAIDVSSAASAGASGANFAGTLVGATNDGTASCGTSGTNAEVWYTFTAPAGCGPGQLRVTTCGTNDGPGQDIGMDTVVSMLTACGGAEITCNDDWSSATTAGCTGLDAGLSRDSAVATTMTPGQTVLVRVSKFNTATPGPFQLHVFYTPVNDSCGSATTVTNGTTNFCTFGATTDGPDEVGACNFFSYTHIENDIWFRYTATCSGTTTVNLCGSGYDTKIGIYGGTCPSSSGQIIACNDDSCGTRSIVTFAASSGIQYLIRIGGYLGDTGAGTMTIACSSPCGSADFNCDGDLGTDADISSFFACLAGNCPAAPCPNNADFNGDGDLGTDADIAAFFSVLAGGSC